MPIITSVLPRQGQSQASLLNFLNSREGTHLPPLKRIAGPTMPQPYRQLLVHSKDLTPTLEAFYQQTLGLTVLNRRREGPAYLREVLLRLAGSGRRVGYGVIRILLDHLPAESAKRVLEEQVPFGSILQGDGIPHLSWPQAFFSADPDRQIQNVLGLPLPCRLYGRRNVLLDGSRKLLAEVIELLAPVNTSPPEDRPPTGNGPRSGNQQEI